MTYLKENCYNVWNKRLHLVVSTYRHMDVMLRCGCSWWWVVRLKSYGWIPCRYGGRYQVTLTLKIEELYSSETLQSASKSIHYHNKDHNLDITHILNLINFHNVRGGKMWRVTAWLSMCNKHFKCKYTYKCILFESVICWFWSVTKELLPFAVVTEFQKSSSSSLNVVLYDNWLLVLGIFIWQFVGRNCWWLKCSKFGPFCRLKFLCMLGWRHYRWVVLFLL
jgi:hypothetical protein